MTTKTSGIIGVILAGGQASRWGGQDKGLIVVDGRPMIAHVIAALEPQVERIIVSANRNLDEYRSFGWPVVADASAAFLGPLAGLAGGMAAAGKGDEWVVIVPCDSPLLAHDLVDRLHAALTDTGADVAVAHDGQRVQPVFAMVRRGLLPDLREFLESGGRKTDQWYGRHRTELVDFSDCADNFLNINAPDDRAKVEAIMNAAGGQR